MMTSTLQVAAMASDEPRFQHPPAGIVLYASAINVVRTPVMRLQLSFAAIANVFAPGLKLSLKATPEQHHRHPEEVRRLLLSQAACSRHPRCAHDVLIVIVCTMTHIPMYVCSRVVQHPPLELQINATSAMLTPFGFAVEVAGGRYQAAEGRCLCMHSLLHAGRYGPRRAER
jgi:hypothetical protein